MTNYSWPLHNKFTICMENGTQALGFALLNFNFALIYLHFQGLVREGNL